MGACFSMHEFSATRPRIVVMLGLDGSGSTTTLYQLQLGKRLRTIPTLGVNHEMLKIDGVHWECWDIGGLDKLRPLWLKYSREADGIVFVVDSTDYARWNIAAYELAKLYRHDDESDPSDGDSITPVPPRTPLLIFLNKQDLPNAASVEQVHAALCLKSLPVKNYRIFPCSAVNKATLHEGTQWLSKQMLSVDPGCTRHTLIPFL